MKGFLRVLAFGFLVACPAAASQIPMTPNPLVFGDRWESGSLDASLRAVAASDAEIVFELAVSYTGSQDPFLLSFNVIEIVFGDDAVEPLPSLAFLSGHLAPVFFVSPCLLEPVCPRMQFAVTDHTVVSVSVRLVPGAPPSTVTVTASRVLGLDPYPTLLASGSGRLHVVPEPGVGPLVGAGLLALAATARSGCGRRLTRR